MRNLIIYGVLNNVTVSWNIMSEELFPHSCGLIVGPGKGTSNVDVTTTCSVTTEIAIRRSMPRPAAL